MTLSKSTTCSTKLSMSLCLVKSNRNKREYLALVFKGPTSLKSCGRLQLSPK